MKKILYISLAILMIFITACSNNQVTNNSTKDLADKAFEETIDLNGINANKIIEEEQGEKIIMNSVALTQIAEVLDLKLAGIPTTKTGKIPERYKNIFQIGLPMNPNMEVIKSINPTIVYIPDNLEDWVGEGFKKHNINHHYINLRSVESLYSVTKEIATKHNKEEKIKKLEEEKEKFFTDYNEKIKNKQKPKVLILMGLPGSYVVASENSYVGNLVKLAGGENIIKSDKEFESVNMEYILSKDPDYILRASHAMPENIVAMFEEEFKTNTMWGHFRAVKENKVFDLDYKIFGMTAQFNYTDGLNYLEKIFYN